MRLHENWLVKAEHDLLSSKSYNGIRKTQKEIARKLGISRSYVSRIEKRV